MASRGEYSAEARIRARSMKAWPRFLVRDSLLAWLTAMTCGRNRSKPGPFKAPSSITPIQSTARSSG